MTSTNRKSKGRFTSLRKIGEELNPDYWILRAALLLVVALLVLLGWWLGENRKGYRLGEPSPQNYVAIVNTKYTDDEGTETLRRLASENVVAVLTKDSHAERRIRDMLQNLNRRDGAAAFPVTLRQMLEAMPPAKQRRTLQLARQLGLSVIEDKNWGKDIQSSLWDRITRLPIERPDQNAVFQILEEVFQQPVKMDDDATEKLKKETAAKVEPLERILYTGDLILRRGDVVTPQKMRLLEAQGYPKGDLPYRTLIILLLGVFLWSLLPSLQGPRSENRLTRQNMTFIISLLGAGWTIQVLSTSLLKSDTLAFLPLLGWLNLTLPVQLAFNLGLGGVVIGSILSSSGSVAQMILWILSGTTACIAGYIVFRGYATRLDLLRQQCIMGFSAAISALVARWWLTLPLDFEVLAVYLLAILAWGIFTVALLPMLDTTFDILSPLRLMDLSHPSNPLLKRLQMEAPGTYHHTLMVGTLSEAAADSLGLDSLLVKAGAYFHDIGKLKRPQFFAENQVSGENLHDELNPSMSALIILSHVKDGLDLARGYNLPTRIRNFISEHHGTTCLTYFYRKSKARGEGLPREQFCYPGPKPTSRETALVMLADSVEAAVRAAGGSIKSVVELRETVDGVVESKMLDGQLERIDFTLKDLTLIKESFIQSLRSIYHKRENTGTKGRDSASLEGGDTDEISGSD